MKRIEAVKIITSQINARGMLASDDVSDEFGSSVVRILNGKDCACGSVTITDSEAAGADESYLVAKVLGALRAAAKEPAFKS